jgi:hypothetical protein
MHNKKTYAAIITVLCAALVFVLFGCSDSAEVTTVAPGDTDTVPPATVTTSPTGAVTPTAEPTPTPLLTTEPSHTPPPYTDISPLTGLPYPGDYRPIAVMIEDNPAARPQCGLSQADIVYEALVEGGITRFMAIFSSVYPTRVGPVRSTRTHYVKLANEWDCMFVHFGSSKLAQTMLDTIRIDMDGIRGNVPGVKRDNSKPRPHNVFANLETLYGIYKYQPVGHAFKFGNPSGKKAEKVTVPFNNTFTKIRYEYDSSLGKYLRSVSGEAFIDDSTQEQIAVTNIVIVYCEYYWENQYQQSIDYGKGGKALLVTGGICVDLVWEKESNTEPMRFTDTDGNEMVLNPGNTWFELVRKNTKITVE